MDLIFSESSRCFNNYLQKIFQMKLTTQV